MTRTDRWSRRLTLLALALAGASAACGASTQTRTQAPKAPLSDDAAQELLAKRLESDPNGALCSSVAAKLSSHDIDALKDVMDTRALVERGIKANQLSEERAKVWRQNTEAPHLWQIRTPDDTRFFCLGTFEDEGGAPILVLRTRRPVDSSYMLLRLGGSAERPVTDTLMASGGYWDSELLTVFDSDERRALGDLRGWMFDASYDKKFDEIIARYDELPEEWKRSPFFFREYINAVMTVTVRGKERESERFMALGEQIPVSLHHSVSQARWFIFYYGRLGERAKAEEHIARIETSYKDPIADDFRQLLERLLAR
jgi:hypothetical protein